MSRASGCRMTTRSTRLARLEPLEPRTLLSAGAAGPFHGLTGQGQTVVVIDSGIDYRHAALGGGLGGGFHVVGGYDFTTGIANPLDAGPAGGHGTEVAGVIGSQDAAHPGLAPGADMVALKVVDNNGDSSSILIDEALQWVHAHRNDFRYPITTVNISLSNDSNSETLPAGGGYESDLAQLAADGMFISVAAGNDFAAYGQPGLSYPAVSPNVVPAAAVDAGIPRDRILIDPGLGFAKRAPHTLEAIANLGELRALDLPIVCGPSRKSFLKAALGDVPAAERLWGTAAAVTASVLAGADIVRVHDVRQMVDVVRVADAIRHAARLGPRASREARGTR